MRFTDERIRRIMRVLKIASETNNRVCVDCLHLCFESDDHDCSEHIVLSPDQASEWYSCMSFLFGKEGNRVRYKVK